MKSNKSVFNAFLFLPAKSAHLEPHLYLYTQTHTIHLRHNCLFSYQHRSENQSFQLLEPLGLFFSCSLSHNYFGNFECNTFLQILQRWPRYCRTNILFHWAQQSNDNDKNKHRINIKENIISQRMMPRFPSQIRIQVPVIVQLDHLKNQSLKASSNGCTHSFTKDNNCVPLLRLAFSIALRGSPSNMKQQLVARRPLWVRAYSRGLLRGLACPRWAFTARLHGRTEGRAMSRGTLIDFYGVAVLSLLRTVGSVDFWGDDDYDDDDDDDTHEGLMTAFWLRWSWTVMWVVVVDVVFLSEWIHDGGIHVRHE